jgi:beta-glucosidase
MARCAAGFALLLAIGLVASGPVGAQSSGQAALWGTQGADCHAKPGEAEPWKDTSYSPECRARFVLDQFHTVGEKLDFLDPPPPNEASAGRKVSEEIGLPRIAGSDGPAGIARVGHATAFPSPLAVAASFDPKVASRYGDLLGREFRAAGLGMIGGPAMDMTRTWHFGRLSESFGEDPFLTASMVAPEIRAIQARKVVATMKHFAAYTQEAGRVGDQPSGSAPAVDNIVSEKALREIYLPGFEAAVKQGHVGAVMCSFPRIDGVYSCENPHLFDILKREWGFDGFVEPDFPSGQRSIAWAIMAGLDRGSARPNGIDAALNGQLTLREAVARGIVPEARLDDMILRRLIPNFRIGTYDDPPVRTGEDVSTPEDRAAAADILAAGSVLLKNEKGILPFGSNVRSIAVIGMQATKDATVVEQGSPYVEPAHLEPALPAIEQRAGSRIAVSFAPGTLGLGPLPPFDPALLTAPGGGHGFRAEYYASPKLDFSGKPIATRVVADPSLDSAPAIDGLPANNLWSVRYTATFTPKETGVHRFALHGSGSVRLLVDGKQVAGFVLADFGNAAYANIPLEAGNPVELEIGYTPRSALRDRRMKMFGLEMGLTLRVGHSPPNDMILRAVEAARKADVAVVFAGEQVGEGMDRETLSLQGDQDRLIEAVAQANPNTVVVLSTGGPVAMPWLKQVHGVIETWMPGDAFGPAIAGMLFGDREPGGRLSVTFPANETQGPATKPSEFPGTREPQNGRLDTAYFDEGVLIGYRYYDAHRQQPLFPFGYGLSYGDISLSGAGAETRPDGSILAHVTLANSGKRGGTGVVQVYLGFPEGTGEPPKQLKGFAKAELGPGESRTLEIAIPRKALRYWDEDAPGWRIAPGDYAVYLGTSSRDIAWQGKVTIPGD